MENHISKSIISGFADKLLNAVESDVAIVGAGPSGLICGKILAAAGKNVSIFEMKLAPGGGIWGGAMLNNEIIIQEDVASMLDEYGINYTSVGQGLVKADSVETASALIYGAVHAGAKIFNGVVVEDVVYKDKEIGGVVINWAPVLYPNKWHVDPLIISAKCVLDGTGHDALLTAKVAKKAGIKLDTPTGAVMGEQPMWAEKGEIATVENTKEVYPGLFVSGMAANGVFGSARMGPIFGGMFLSGQKAAELILAKIDG
jgi:thiamine thiazole synthase